MSTDLVITAPVHLAAQPAADRLYEAFLAGRSANTLTAYRQDLDAFSAFLGAPNAQAALDHLLRLPHGDANGALLDYRSAMIGQRLTPATVNRRLTAVRSAIKLGRTLGLTSWVPEVSSLKVQAFRDTRGPGLNGTKALMHQARMQDQLKAARDTAIIRLFFDLGLRRAEVASLDLEHFQRDSERLWILSKGKAQREARTLPAATAEAVAAWLAVRSQVAMPNEVAVFVNLSRTSVRGRRITGRGLHVVISSIGSEAGMKAWPHGLRHASITTALDVLQGDVRAAQRHARHASPDTTMLYDDARCDLAGNVSRALATVLSLTDREQQ